ncbi:MAG: hypothetical protein ACI9MU_004413, partial [Alphaproteobacteria bacterium]
CWKISPSTSNKPIRQRRQRSNQPNEEILATR